MLIAASGNFGPKSPPQYPAADPNVIAVSATDADDKMFRASNIGPHIAVAAPGVDILLPSPGNDYRLISGTSFSAAYVSGVAALMLQRAPGLTPDAVRNILQSTARDLGPAGKDPEYGAGLVDAYQAIMAVQANATADATPTPQRETEQAKRSRGAVAATISIRCEQGRDDCPGLLLSRGRITNCACDFSHIACGVHLSR